MSTQPHVSDPSDSDPRRTLPRVDRLSERVARISGMPEPVVRDVARRCIGSARGSGGPVDPSALEAEVLEQVLSGTSQRRVLNATGVLLHTNLGRAPLAAGDDRGDPEQGYVDLEYDLGTGRRGPRLARLEASLRALSGADAALVVNNNAAAVLLAVTALAAGAEVVISRGQLVEIGGSFRIPEVITQGGARLVEVGTTNRTHIADYRGAIGEHTAALLEVHRSNFAVVGFTSEVGTADLGRIATDAGVPLVVDLGGGLPDTRCGWLPDGPPAWLEGEPGLRQTVAAGADVVTCSGDKLLGGPQAGIVVGRAACIDRMRRHPLARALRFDRTRAAALQRTVDAYLTGTAGSDVELWRLASVPVDVLVRRAEAIVDVTGHAAEAAGVALSVRSADGTVGAGAAPTARIPGAAVVLGPVRCPDGLATALRSADPPIVATVADDMVWLHLRAVDAADDEALAVSLASALRSGPEEGAPGADGALEP